MAVWNCKMCGGNLVSIDAATGLGQCESCGKKQTLPNEADERRTHQFNQANHYRRCNEFDRAAQVYAKILDDDPVEAEAYWGIVLCRYGIEYVEDSKTMQRIPTCHRTLTRSILKDPDYLQALSCARPMARLQYKKEAEEIDRIQKEILMLASKEEPFDIFISYKESDDRSGQRTPDSVLAQDIYTALTKEGYKVFFSRITLEKYLGQAYEPIIYAALRSSKVMVAIGTRKEYFEAPWVRNEWNRYLGMMEETPGEKTLIPVYRDMDPYDLPEEFGHPQALNAANIGFLQDLLHGIEKLIRSPETSEDMPSASGAVQANTQVLLQRVKMFLEDGRFDNARQYCERVLDVVPSDWQSYLYLVLCDERLSDEAQLAQQSSNFYASKNFQNALRFAPPEKKAELKQYVAAALTNKINCCERICSDELQKLEEKQHLLQQLETEIASPLSKLKELEKSSEDISKKLAENMQLCEQTEQDEAKYELLVQELYQKYKIDDEVSIVDKGKVHSYTIKTVKILVIMFFVGVFAGALTTVLTLIIWVLAILTAVGRSVATKGDAKSKPDLKQDQEKYNEYRNSRREARLKNSSIKKNIQALQLEKEQIDKNYRMTYQAYKNHFDRRKAILDKIAQSQEKIQQQKAEYDAYTKQAKELEAF